MTQRQAAGAAVKMPTIRRRGVGKNFACRSATSLPTPAPSWRTKGSGNGSTSVTSSPQPAGRCRRLRTEEPGADDDDRGRPQHVAAQCHALSWSCAVPVKRLSFRVSR